MVECLQDLGFMVNVASDPNETCNRTITVYGLGGKIPGGGTKENPLELFVGNAGTAARFLAALVCLGSGVYCLHGVARMHERPQAALFQALHELGYRIDSPNDKLPALLNGLGRRTGKCVVSIQESSQFASALLLCANTGNWIVEIVGENAEESPYLEMTKKLIRSFPAKGGDFQIEPDASSGSYFFAAARLAPRKQIHPKYPTPDGLGSWEPRETWVCSVVSVAHWPASGWQIDQAYPNVAGAQTSVSRQTDLGDSIMTAIVMAALEPHAASFTDLGRLRLQECERVAALRTELTKCGVEVLEQDDILTVFPSVQRIHGAEIETYNDHRIGMCFAILGLKVPGIKIKNPSCVKKTFPNFFQKLATLPPHGLGATILDGRTGRQLAIEELFAE
jgi:3-phosphoshikimate 1-carboxyvinyltransferase